MSTASADPPVIVTGYGQRDHQLAEQNTNEVMRARPNPNLAA